MDNEKLISAFWTVFGLIIGWVLTLLSQWLQNRKTENRKRKKILFHMLEIYDVLDKPKFDFSIIVETFIGKFTAHPIFSGVVITEEEKAEMKKTYIPLFV